MKSCKTCKHFKPRGRGQILGDCRAWTKEDLVALLDHLPSSFSLVVPGVLAEEGSNCAFHATKKRGKK
jgi:hypothetical protein